VQDNDKSETPSQGDSFAIKLSGSTTLGSQLPGPVVYARAGTLSSGNLTVD
jgi:hypothetical protein